MKFVSLCFAIFLSEVISMTTLTYLASYALTYNIDETKSYLMLTLVNVCGIPSRLLSGLLADKYGRFNVMCLSATLTTVFIFGCGIQQTIWLCCLPLVFCLVYRLLP